MAKIYIEVPIAERMPVMDHKTPRLLQKIFFIDNCNVKHVHRFKNTISQKHLLNLGYTHWLEEVEVSEDVLELVKGGASCK